MARVFVVLAVAVIASSILHTDARKNGKKVFPPAGQKDVHESERRSLPTWKPTSQVRGVDALPETFDARVKWPKCESIKLIRDQGMCGTCWAVSSASVASDRLCIASGQKDNTIISANQAASCTMPEQSPDENCEAGGDPATVYKYMSMKGLPSGGEFNSKKGCVPYQVGGEDAPPLSCAKRCTNSNYPTAIDKDTKTIDTFWSNYQKDKTKMTQPAIDAAVKQMKNELFTSGPITATIVVWDDFQRWDPDTGLCYKGPGPGAQNKGGHAIRIIGWNKDKSGTPYWMIANSWGTDVGDNGIYWLQMGKNTIGIEATISAPIVTMLNTCDGQSFCDSPIDLSATAKIKDPASPKFLFQGNCTQEVAPDASGKLKAVGPAMPIAKKFVGGPPGPYTRKIVQNDQLWLLNAQGQACGNTMANGQKFNCTAGSASMGGDGTSVDFYTGSTLTTYSYYPDNKDWLFDTNGRGKNIGKMISGKFASVTTMLNIDGKKMAIFGKDAAGKAVTGIMAYPGGSQAGFAWVVEPGPASNVLTCSK